MRVSVVLRNTRRLGKRLLGSPLGPRRARDFANFAYAASRRYPRVHLWMIWAEPTRRANFLLLRRERRDRPLTRRMKRRRTRTRGCWTLPTGASSAAAAGTSSSAATRSPRATFRRAIGSGTCVCRVESRRAWICTATTLQRSETLPHRRHLGHGFADFSDLDLLARWVDRYLGRPRRKRRMKLFLSELFWPTDHRNHEFNFWVTRRTAARWLSDAPGPRGARRGSTRSAGSPLRRSPPPARRRGKQGLLTRSGRKKPAYRAYKRG